MGFVLYGEISFGHRGKRRTVAFSIRSRYYLRVNQCISTKAFAQIITALVSHPLLSIEKAQGGRLELAWWR